MESEKRSKDQAKKKLIKTPRAPRHVSLQYPKSLEEGEDVEEDVTAARDGQVSQHANQSVFSMIAAAGSKVDFHARFEGESSESEGEQEPSITALHPSNVLPRDGQFAVQTKSPKQNTLDKDLSEEADSSRLSKSNYESIQEKDNMPQSSRIQSADDYLTDLHQSITPHDAPIMSMMLEARAKLGSAETNRNVEEAQTGTTTEDHSKSGPTSLACRLKEIFGFENPEKVISEYPCWLLQSVLLQGYMYITQYHLCFYAYLPKKSNVIVKSGHLSKRGRQNPKFTRYWFTLKGDVLSYYSDPSALYFPRGNIDLRYGISATLLENKDKGKDQTNFSVTTHQRTYYFKADTAASAKEWVKTLQKVIFRSHNDGDSVKISLPVENIIDIEESPVIEFADTVKIRVVDNDETYAIDEYFFSFFGFGRDALDVLRKLIDSTAAQKMPTNLLTPSTKLEDISNPFDLSQSLKRVEDNGSGSSQGPGTPVLREGVRTTLGLVPSQANGQASPRLSGDWSRNSIDMGHRSVELGVDAERRSLDVGRSSSSTNRRSLARKQSEDEPPPSLLQASSDSFVHNLEQCTESTSSIHSGNFTKASGSQILDRSDLFHSPTIPNFDQHANFQVEEVRSRSEDTARATLNLDEVHATLPTKSHAQQSSSKGRKCRLETLERPDRLQHSSSSPTLQQLVKAGTYPLQRAAGFADFLRTRSKRMSGLLATESMGYVEKVSDMWAGGRKHYGEKETVLPDDPLKDLDDEDGSAAYGDRFRAHFALPSYEKLQATYFGYLHRVLPLYGKIYISNRKLCFRSLLPGTRTKMILPLKDIENVDKEKGFRFGYSGLVVVIRGHEELFFEFRLPEIRDDCVVTLLENLESVRYLQESGLLTQQDKADAEVAKAEHIMLQEARQENHYKHDLKLPTSATQSPYPSHAPPILFDDPRASILNFKPTESLRITCLTIGSRGDVQPYIAFCKGLLKEGHRPKIATHAEFEPWVRKHGIAFAPVDGDPAELMRICVDNGMFTYSFLKEASAKFRGWIDELLVSAWKACQDTDLLVESPSAMAGVHIAEALQIPYFRAFTMPWTRTRAYPHAFAVPEHKLGGAYNYITYIMFDNVFWKAIAGQVNRWRKRDLGLRSTNLDKMQPNKIPFLYNFSPSVVVPPLDYSDWIRVTGYWFLDEASGWTPPEDLVNFIRKASTDDKKLVYIGFGSIVVSDPAALTKTVIDSVLKADVRCILSKGWSDRLGNQDAAIPEVPLPAEIYQIKSVPHDWLFTQIDAAVHHGGAGTTGASLRAGLPTIVKPFFGDQFFFGSRLEDLGVGICMEKLNVSVFSRALWEATHSKRMIVKARVLGEQIRKETGVATAIQALYRDLEYAKSLIKHRASTTEQDDPVADEESWTFIGDESDPELARRIREWEPLAQRGEEALNRK